MEGFQASVAFVELASETPASYDVGVSDEKCMLCGGRLASGVARPRSSYAETGIYRIAVCTDCGAGTTLPRPTEAGLARVYERYAYDVHALIEAEKRRRARWLLQWSRVGGRILDVGCMFGYLLDEARALGMATAGVELSADAGAVAAARGHDVVAGTIEDRHGQFDAIIAQHVLEHVTDPHAFLAAAQTRLAPGGRLVICVPNFEARLRRVARSSWGWYQVPVHVHHFSSRALHRLLAAAGFSVVDQRVRGGDTLFLLLCLFQALRLRPGARASGRFARAALQVLGELTRPYYNIGDDELVMVATVAR